MNLHSLARGAIGAVNPFISAQWFASAGFTTVDFKQVPAYADPVTVQIQKQELSFKDLQHVDGMNLQGVFCSIYLNGAVRGVDRGSAGGGDKFVFDGQTWLVVAVPEQWPDWCRVILCLQVAP